MTLHHQQFDTIVIGGGQAGPFLASKLDARGEKVAVFQEGPFGGTCLNDGCRPTKALRASAHAAHAARTAAPYGVHVQGVSVNVAEAVERKDAIIGKWRDSSTDYYENHDTISYVTARARLDGKDGDLYRVTFDGTTVTAPRVILNPAHALSRRPSRASTRSTTSTTTPCWISRKPRATSSSSAVPTSAWNWARCGRGLART